MFPKFWKRDNSNENLEVNTLFAHFHSMDKTIEYTEAYLEQLPFLPLTEVFNRWPLLTPDTKKSVIQAFVDGFSQQLSEQGMVSEHNWVDSRLYLSPQGHQLKMGTNNLNYASRSKTALLDRLAELNQYISPILSQEERLDLLERLLLEAKIPQPITLYYIRKISALTRALNKRESKWHYKHFLYPEQTRHWEAEEQADDFTQQLTERFNSPDAFADAQVINQRNTKSVYRMEIFGRDCLVKQFSRQHFYDRFRITKGRHSWAIAKTIEAMYLNTPTPYGFLELSNGDSFYFSEYESAQQDARSWIKPWLHQKNPALKAAIHQDLLTEFIRIYQCGIYHRDTKATNMLIAYPENNERRSFKWVDIESATIPIFLNGHKIRKNLIQLNGSIGRKISRKERVAFLLDVAKEFPTLHNQGTIRKIERVTRKRLKRELLKICGY